MSHFPDVQTCGLYMNQFMKGDNSIKGHSKIRAEDMIDNVPHMLVCLFLRRPDTVLKRQTLKNRNVFLFFSKVHICILIN